MNYYFYFIIEVDLFFYVSIFYITLSIARKTTRSDCSLVRTNCFPMFIWWSNCRDLSVQVNYHYRLFDATGDSQNGMHKRTVYEHNRVAMCSQKRALCVATIVLSILFTVSLIIAFAGPQTGEHLTHDPPDCGSARVKLV